MDSFLRPPDWSLDLGIAGRSLVWLAVLLYVASAAGWLFSPKIPRLEKPAKLSFTLGGFCLFGTFVVLGILFAYNRLEYQYVWQHGDSQTPLQYKIAGIWSGQEGSFLLWACASAVFGILAARGAGVYRRWYTVIYGLFLGCLSAILCFESPFVLNMLNGRPVIPAEGNGMAPSLLNYWVTIHPPTIFLGFGSLTVLFAFALAAMITRRTTDWVSIVRPWAIVSMTLVGVGLCMGGFWAYETLGWGGFWMWDPVENTSFVPWVFTIALVHGIMVQVTKKGWTLLNLLLGGLPFMLFAYGTFLTRSGLLGDTSVHSFAEMNGVALKVLLGILVGSVLIFMTLWFVRAVQFFKESPEADPPNPGISRERWYRVSTVLLSVLGLGAAFGMSVPFVMNVLGHKPRVVEEGVYHHVLTYAYIPLMLVMAAAPLTAWKGISLSRFVSRILGVVCITMFLVGGSMIAMAFSPSIRQISGEQMDLPFHLHIAVRNWIILLTALSGFVIVSNLWRMSELIKRSKFSAAAFLSHIGVAVLMAGLIISRGFERKEIIEVQKNAPAVGLGYTVSYKGPTSTEDDRNNALLFDMKKGGEHWVASPGFYKIDKGDGEQTQVMVWPYIQHHAFYDVYFALQPPVSGEGSLQVPVGGTVTVDRFVLEYVKPTQKGTPGTPGAQFGALLRVHDNGKFFDVNPTIELTSNGMTEQPIPLSNDISISVGKLDAATKTAEIKAIFKDSIYPVQMFYKPMTILVWLGTGLMAFAGLLSAWYRRRPKSISTDEERTAQVEPDPKPAGKSLPRELAGKR
jgi:cytochrome c-type biogenesis protein CcmF